MVEMRYLAVVACCLWVNAVWCGAQPAASPLQQWADGRADRARGRRAAPDGRPAAPDLHRDYDLDSIVFAKLILRELARELRGDENPPRAAEDEVDVRDVTDAMAKRKPFWQPMGGPLPVETRLASFGTKIIPEDSHNAPNRFKAMRYGRR